tara:strand:+ start:107 stop:592 length:486 start_codon:yes stop_codon:yes gene_type:complete
MVKLYVSLFGLGFIPFASGTIGSLAGIALWLALREIISPWIMILAIVLIFILSWPITEVYLRKNKEHDPAEVIIDEVIGQWVSLIPLIYLDSIEYPMINNQFYEFLLSSFLLFRFFDIFKPWPISIIDRQKNSFSVLFDDVLAGFFSSICITGYILWIYLA